MFYKYKLRACKTFDENGSFSKLKIKQYNVRTYA